jgi:uncharacterized membrane protein YfcA
MLEWHGINFLYSITGFLIGGLVGFTGVGGGALMTPLLVLLFGIVPTTAVGTDLIYASITKTTGTLVHGFHGTVEWRIVRRLATGSIPATILTILALKFFGGKQHAVSGVITSVLGFALILTAVTLIFRKWLLAHLTRFTENLTERQTALITVVLGVFLGVLVSISSVGAGAIGVTVLVLLYPQLPAARIVGSDIAHAVPLTFFAGIGHLFLGSIDVHLLVALLIGSLPGITIGSHLAARVPDRVLRPVLASTLALTGARLIV